MKKVTIVGVPEHFNFPWNLCIDNGEFAEHGIELEWQDIPEGTGRMCTMLRNGEADLAVILSEGIIKDISQGNQVQILQEYVSSPLRWGIHVANQSAFKNIEDLKGKRIAISRYGSGSHLMAIVHAKQMNWDLNQLEFVVINTLDGAIAALHNNKADYFMWERFMTQPIVDQKIFRRIGECPTPWPSFVVVARKEFAEQNNALIKHLLEIINTTTSEFKHIPSIDRTLATKYNQKLEDIQAWLKLTQWSQKQLPESKYQKITEELKALDLLEEVKPYKEVIL
ncbi:substrate-binding domain-containing protein [Myroides injenensis]|uniref:substrate-binding domain-containing protein n=1 Tax=Myroides injenensis TaxID=1183151 RepID=UPI00227215C3|nr:substrate-binding domain-containing protein [Myroides injenensis]